jgi:hypothetical protein
MVWDFKDQLQATARRKSTRHTTYHLHRTLRRQRHQGHLHPIRPHKATHLSRRLQPVPRIRQQRQYHAERRSSHLCQWQPLLPLQTTTTDTKQASVVPKTRALINCQQLRFNGRETRLHRPSSATRYSRTGTSLQTSANRFLKVLKRYRYTGKERDEEADWATTVPGTMLHGLAAGPRDKLC